MNFYKRHIGDYIKDAGHLTLLEHGVYTRLMDVYYTREAGIPEDKAARLIGARSKDELQALQTVLTEFFELESGNWTQRRCEFEIAEALEKGEKNRENGKKGGRPRKSGNQSETESQSEQKPDGLFSENRTVSKNNLSQTPDTINQTPDKTLGANTASETLQVQGIGLTAGAVSKLCRSHGVMTNPSDPRILKIVSDGVAYETIGAALQDARRALPTASIGIGYVLKILERWAAEAAALNVAGATKPSSSSKDQSRASAMNSLGLGGHHDEQPFTFDAATGRAAD